MTDSAQTDPGFRWRVLKFGGSSVAEAGNWRHIADAAQGARDEGRGVVIVVSALAGITDLLDACLQEPEDFDAERIEAEVVQRHARLAEALGARVTEEDRAPRLDLDADVIADTKAITSCLVCSSISRMRP